MTKKNNGVRRIPFIFKNATFKFDVSVIDCTNSIFNTVGIFSLSIITEKSYEQHWNKVVYVWKIVIVREVIFAGGINQRRYKA